MRWPWQRHRGDGAEYIAAAEAAAQNRLQRARAQSDAIARRTDEVIAETSPTDIVSRVARVLRATDH